MRHSWLTISGLGAVFLLVSFAWLYPVQAEHRLMLTTHLLDQAGKDLLDDLVATVHHQYDTEHFATDEVLAVLEAGTLRGQAHAIRTLVERGNISDAQLRIAVRELENRMQTAGHRVLHAHVTARVRQDFKEMQDQLDALSRQLNDGFAGGRHYYYDH